MYNMCKIQKIVPLTSFNKYIHNDVVMQVNVRHINILAVKNNYNRKNTAAARWEVTAEDV
jgi:hypothetical protein